MASRENLRVIAPAPLHPQDVRGNGSDLYAPRVGTVAEQRTIPREPGVKGRRLTHTEVAEVVEAAHAMGVRAGDVTVERRSAKGGPKRYDQNGQRARLVAYERNSVRENAKERYKIATEEENNDRIWREDPDDSFWTRGWSRIIARPVTSIYQTERGLTTGKYLGTALYNIQDSITSAVHLNFPEYDNIAVKPSKFFSKLFRWRPIAYVSSILTGSTGIDVPLDATQAAIDVINGKGSRRTMQNLITVIIDHFPSPFFNLAIIGKALDAKNNAVRRADMRMAKEAMTDPMSPKYQYREQVARAVLNANSLGRDITHAGKFSDEINMDLINARFAAFDQKFDQTSWFAFHFGKTYKELRDAESHLLWQKDIAELMDIAHSIAPSYVRGSFSPDEEPTPLLDRVIRKVTSRPRKWAQNRIDKAVNKLRPQPTA